jgi:type I restriction enzyme R subunit
MGLSQADTRAILFDRSLHARGWTENLIRRGETASAIEVIEGKPRKQAAGRIENTLRVQVNPNTQLIAMARSQGCRFAPYPWSGKGQRYAFCPVQDIPLLIPINGMEAGRDKFSPLARPAGQGTLEIISGECRNSQSGSSLTKRRRASR